MSFVPRTISRNGIGLPRIEKGRAHIKNRKRWTRLLFGVSSTNDRWSGGKGFRVDLGKERTRKWKKRGKNGHCAGQLQRDRITESCTGKWSATGVLRTLRNRKTRVTGAFRCVGSNSLLWELFITRLMPRLEPGDLRNVQSRTHLICLETTTILLLEHMFRVE